MAGPFWVLIFIYLCKFIFTIMAGGVNKVILVGNLGRDPEVRRTDAGIPWARFTLATTEYIRKPNGERDSRTEWHNIVMWRGLAEIAEKYLRKGSKVYLEGKLRTRSWDDKDGQKKYLTEIEVTDFTMLDSRRENENPPVDNPSAAYSQPAPTPQPQSPSSPSAPVDDLPVDDDLPF